MEFIKYIFKGIIHYIGLLFAMLDFKDYGFMYLIIVGMVACFIFNKGIRKSAVSVIKTLFCIAKTIIGLIFIVIFAAYYFYVIIYFEDKINITILVMTVYLLLKSFIDINLNLLSDKKNSTAFTIKEFAIPVILLCIQRILIMIEIDSFENISYVLYSLIIIPVFTIVFSILKHYINFEDFYKNNYNDSLYFLKLPFLTKNNF